MGIYDYDKTASNNNTIGGITITDGVMRTNTVDNCFQALSADLARIRDDQSSQIDSTGTSGNFAITSNSTITAYAAGQRVHFKANHAPGGAATLNVDLVGQRAIEKRGGLALASGDIVANQHCIVEYDATRDVFELLNPNGAEVAHTHTLADITDSGALAALDTVATAQIDNDAVTFDKLANGTADVLRGHDGSGNPSEVTLGTGLTLSAGELSSTGSSMVLHVQQQETGGGGNVTVGTWTQRETNTIVLNEISGASLAANVITLPAGTYKVTGYQIFSGVSDFQTRLRNTADNVTVALGACGSTAGGGNVALESSINGKFTLAASKTLEIQYYVDAGGNLGRDVNSGEQNVFSDLMIEKVG